jgi:hypothetical protein
LAISLLRSSRGCPGRTLIYSWGRGAPLPPFGGVSPSPSAEYNVAVTTYVNPFSGRCIHGREGARVERGRLTNPSCERCEPRADGPLDGAILRFDFGRWQPGRETRAQFLERKGR